MKKIWPPIRKTVNHGNTAFIVDARQGGKGERRFFRTRGEAEGFAQTQRIRRQNEGHAGFDDSGLSLYGWTVARAIEFALEHLQRQAASVPVLEAVEALRAFKAGRVGDTRHADIKNRLARFVAHFVGRAIATISPEEINEFLATIPHPATRNEYRKEIVMLWHFSRSKKWVREGLDRNLVQRMKEPEKARIILTVEQSVQLMEASVDDDVLALYALILFGGCRREEVEKMDWKHVDLRAGHINITAEISKVSTERFAPIPDNLRAWLYPLAKKSGPIVSRILIRPLRETWKRAGIYPWPQDAHRHSFISYRRQLVGDAQTALEAGTSETIIKRHYKRPVTKNAATRYFAIVPAANAAGKIVAIGKAA